MAIGGELFKPTGTTADCLIKVKNGFGMKKSGGKGDPK